MSKKRKIVLTPRLSEAFKLAKIRVTKEESEAEKDFVERTQKTPMFFDPNLSYEMIRKFIGEHPNWKDLADSLYDTTVALHITDLAKKKP